jgi:flagellar protein FlaJ
MVTILAGLGAFVFMSYVMFPKDKFMIDEETPAVVKLKKLVFMALAMSAGIGLALAFTKAVPVPLAIAAAGGPLLLPGLKAKKLEGHIRKLDDYYSSFAMHLGDVYSTVGSLGQSLKSVLRSDFGVLSKDIESMYNRVTNRIKIEDAFKLLSSDTGSAIISSSNEVLANSMVKGANMRDVGERLSETAAKFLEIRRKRQQSAKAFESTLLMMHVLTLAVLALMNKLLGFLQEFFSLQQNLVGSAQSAVSLSAIDPAVMAIVLPVEAVVLAGINAMALKVFQGGSFHTIWYTLAILLITGGLVLFGVDWMLGNLLQNITLGTNLEAITK